MAQSGPEKIKLPDLHQVGIVVDDVEEVAKQYWNKLGIGPWSILEIKAPVLYDGTYHGKPAAFEFKAALAQVGNCELELMETIKGPTAYEDFHNVHGEGLHHLQYLVDSTDVINDHARKLAAWGFPSVGSGRFGSNGGFNYIDTTPALKTVWEPVKMPDEFDGEVVQYPADESAVSPAKVKVKGINQIGIVVKNLEETIQKYWDILGIGPWDICEVKPPLLTGQTYSGKPADFTMRVSFVMMGPIEIELLQPVSGNNVYSDFLAEHGEGLHHIQFQVDNVDATTKAMAEQGYPVAMSGNFMDGAFAYYDTVKDLKCIWESFQPPTSAPSMTKCPI